MSAAALLQVVLGELEGGDRAGETLYREIVQTLWHHGLAGATVLRADAGIGAGNEYRTVVLEEIAFNNLPIILEAVDERERIEALLPELKAKISHGEIATMAAIRILEEEWPVHESDHLMLKIYLREEAHGMKPANGEDILQLLRERELIWSTVTRALEGFGQDHVIHKQTLFSFSSHAPVVIEAVGTADVIRGLIPELKRKLQNGLAVAVPVQVVADR